MIKITITGEIFSQNPFINETAYRVLNRKYQDINVNDENGNSVTYKVWGVWIDGLVDFKLISDIKNRSIYKEIINSTINTYSYKQLQFKVSPVHQAPVLYTLRADADATENTYLYGSYRAFYGINTTVKYNPQQLFFDSYFDDGYAMTAYHYDPVELKEIWDTSSLDNLRSATGKNIEIGREYYYKRLNLVDNYIYSFRNHPVTVEQGRMVIVKPEDEIEAFEYNSYNVQWFWKTYGIEDRSNWKNQQNSMQKMTLFESVNDALIVRPQMIGSQSIEMWLTDVFGNTLKNTAGGNVYVKEKRGN